MKWIKIMSPRLAVRRSVYPPAFRPIEQTSDRARRANGRVNRKVYSPVLSVDPVESPKNQWQHKGNDLNLSKLSPRLPSPAVSRPSPCSIPIRVRELSRFALARTRPGPITPASLKHMEAIPLTYTLCTSLSESRSLFQSLVFANELARDRASRSVLRIS